MSAPTPPTDPKPAVKSRGAWAVALSVLGAVAALEPAILDAVLAPLWALLAAVGLEVPGDWQERTATAARAAIALSAALLILLSRFVRPDGAAIQGLFRTGLALLVLLPLGCASIPGLGPPPPAGTERADQVDPATLALALANLGAQAYVFSVCPEDARFVRVTPGSLPQFMCGATPAALLDCPEPDQVVTGVDVYVDPADGQKRAMPVCQDAGEIQAAPAAAEGQP